jgi:subtilase family serine protease
MAKVCARLACAAALLLFFVAPGSTQPSSRDRIQSVVDASNVAAVPGTAHPMAQPQYDQGRTSLIRQLSGVSLTFRLSPAQQADLNQLLRDQQDRTSANYHKWLTPDQYAARFGMSSNDLAKVTSWLTSQGLTVDGVSRNRNEVRFSGSVGQVEYALKTEIHDYSIKGEQHFANATDVSLPAAFSSEVLGVRGLNDFHPKPRLHIASPRFTSSLSGVHNLVPGDFATIYDLNSLYSAGIDGTAQTIAVVGQTLISTSDLDTFRTLSGLPVTSSSNFVQIQLPSSGTAVHCSGDETEADLDLEWSEGVAKNAKIKYIYAGLGTGSTCGSGTNGRTKDAFDALQYAITSDAAPIISISYGNCEANLGSFVLTMQQWAQQANSQGQTISGPGGDSGAADCDTGNVATNLAVDVPASVPEVTGVGGTEFNPSVDPRATLDPSNSSCYLATTYWSKSCSPTSGASAVSYIPEVVWNDTTASIANGGGLSSGGGGASKVFGKPSWQTGTGVPADGKRDVPDISLNAGVFEDAYLICSQDWVNQNDPGFTSCSIGYRDSNSIPERVGGTSGGAPTFAGVLALVNQATSSNGLGNVNPMLYRLAASSPGAFHDITSGNNKATATGIGFSAGTGYDQASGLGSLDVANLVAAWVSATPGSADFSIDGRVSTASSPGQPGTSTITVTAENGFTGTVSLSCSPSSGTAQISCSLNPTSVDLSSAKTGTSTLSITTVAELRPPAGRHQRGLWLMASGGVFSVIILGGLPSRRRWVDFLGLLAVASIITAVGCGGGGGSVQQKSQGTPAGTYTITVTGTSGSISHSAAVSFTVQ